MSEKILLTADPGAGFRAHADELRVAVERVLTSGYYILGPEVEAFEAEFSAYQGGGHTVGVANGTEAIELALRAVGVRAGDGVATVANTVSATISAIEQIGARPVFVEIDPATMLMSPTALAETLAQASVPVRAVVPVHLYGQPADLGAICAQAQARGIPVVEDCAQAHGARWAGRRAGTWGAAAAFSFYPTKNLGALGDGGAVFSGDVAVAERVRRLRQYGWRQRYLSEEPGRNSRLDELQAAILRVKLRHLDAENAHRARLAARYCAAARALPGLVWPTVAAQAEHVWHQFVVRTPKRDALVEYLSGRGIRAGVLYPVPAHRQPAYAQAISLPATEQACAEVLSLPCHPGLTEVDVDRVLAALKEWPTP